MWENRINAYKNRLASGFEVGGFVYNEGRMDKKLVVELLEKYMNGINKKKDL